MNHMKTKICTKCGAHLPATTNNFYTKINGKYGLESECKKNVKELEEQNIIKS